MTFSCAILAPNLTGYYTIMAGFLAIILLAFFTTKWLSKTKFSGAKSKNMQMIERMYLASDKMLTIVKIGETYYLMSQDKTGIKLIDKLQNFEPIENNQETKFSDILDKFKSVSKDK